MTTLKDAVRSSVKKTSGKSRQRTQKLLRRFRRATDAAELIAIACAIEHRIPGFGEDIGLSVAKKFA